METSLQQLFNSSVFVENRVTFRCFSAVVGWRGGLMVIALDSGSNGPGLSLGQGTALRS